MEQFLNKDRKFIFKALEKAKKTKPEALIKELKNSGLRGRGGAGFPTGFKWECVFFEKESPKYVVCNAHEGEPKTLKDKYLLKKFPHLVLGGMVIAAYTLGSKDLYITIKETYKKAQKTFKKEISIFKRKGFLKNINITVLPAKLGYIGGEESALLYEIEGKRIEPRQKPPFVSSVGLFLKPTLINNVESFANIPYIIYVGVKEFKKFGTKNSPGKKMITVAGDVGKPGVYEIEFGETINNILKIADGPLGKIKFALTGGYAGTVVLPKFFNTPFEFDSFQCGVCVGAGTIIFYNEKTNLSDCLKTWLSFFRKESCGQCTPCREGTFKAYEIVSKIKGKISPKDLEKIEELFFAMNNSSFCPLGCSVSLASSGLLKSFKKELVSGK